MSSGEGTELPHWADPPTGEVPRALAGQRGEDDMQAWRLLGSRGLHWRDDVNGWSDGPGVEDLVDEDDAPVTPPPANRGGPYSFDEEFERLDRERAWRGGSGPDRTYPGGPHQAGGATAAGEPADVGAPAHASLAGGAADTVPERSTVPG
ncbi:MAG: hypothetical protein ACRDZX_03840, partial [Acidimicrobiales bacterium]